MEVGIKYGKQYFKMVVDDESGKVINLWWEDKISYEEYRKLSESFRGLLKKKKMTERQRFTV